MNDNLKNITGSAGSGGALQALGLRSVTSRYSIPNLRVTALRVQCSWLPDGCPGTPQRG